ncbi:non-ribosomal peptide synthetase [Micromonospora sp. NPDC050980]|uniref:non-ribosomal peptide synthetase n=1 Tax=Micromonospora sp. NPDC050980 TaxID=3155161 RepID=UPI0033D7560E
MVERDGASHLLTVPSLYLAMLDAAVPGQLDSLRTVIVAGEAVPARVPELHQERVPTAELANEYGVTEATVWSSLYRCPPDQVPHPLPIGTPIPGTELRLLDDALDRSPAGTTGELAIAGAGVSRGYLARPALTAERFVPDPFGPPGSRMYLTGDLARLVADGNLLLVGRRDEQIKLRGFRIEPQEIEAAIVGRPDVREAAVVVVADGAGEPHLGAYLVPAGTGPLDLAALRDALRDALPEYMVPTGYLVLDDLPRTPNGKVDRGCLPPMDLAVHVARAEYAGASGEAEAVLLDIWQELFQMPSISVHDDFFALGGHSLLALHLLSRIEDLFGLELPLQALFEAPTVRALATLVAGALPDQPHPSATAHEPGERATE